MELKQRDSLSKKNTYRVSIRDLENGEISHHCNRPLNEHIGYSFDKHKIQRGSVK